jgi:hypothetical protein
VLLVLLVLVLLVLTVRLWGRSILRNAKRITVHSKRDVQRQAPLPDECLLFNAESGLVSEVLDA